MACVPPIPSLAEDDVDEEMSKKQERLPPVVDTSQGDGSTESCKTSGPNYRCGLAPQCGCPPNETCDVTNESGVVSCVSSGKGTLGRPCLTASDCLAGLGCFFSTCRPYCNTPTEKCTVAGTDLCVRESAKGHENRSYCTISCDLREPAGVCGTNSCRWLSLEGTEVTDCDQPGTGEAMAPCGDDWECKPGLSCRFNPSRGVGECMRWCRLGMPDDCTAEFLTCQDLLGEYAPVINGTKYGLCLEPQPVAL